MLESLFNKVVDLKAWNFIKKRLEHRCFPVKLAKFLRTTFLQNTSGGCFWRCFIFYHHDLAKCSVCISCRVTYALQSESTLYSCQGTPCSKQARNLKFKWLDWTRTHNNLVRKRTLTHLAKLASLAKWLSVRLQTNWLWVQAQLQSLKCSVLW